jgi:hypothetical protein
MTARHVRRVESRRAVADAINAAVLRYQRPITHSPLDRAFGDPGAEQLRTRHVSVRPAADPGEFLLDCPALGSHTDP